MHIYTIYIYIYKTIAVIIVLGGSEVASWYRDMRFEFPSTYLRRLRGQHRPIKIPHTNGSLSWPCLVEI